MIKLTIILLLVILILVLVATVVTLARKLSYLNKKVLYSENLIEEYIGKKTKLLIKLNASIKKILRAKKDYLVNLDELNTDELTNHDKDVKLSEYDITVNNLLTDYTKLSTNKDIKKQISNLYEINEKNDAAKTYFNKYVKKLSQNIKKFPNNVLAKFLKIKIIPLYETNETIKKLNEANL